MSTIESVAHETRVFEPSPEFVRQANVNKAEFDRLNEAVGDATDDAGGARWVVDLRHVEYVGSALLGLLVAAPLLPLRQLALGLLLAAFLALRRRGRLGGRARGGAGLLASTSATAAAATLRLGRISGFGCRRIVSGSGG